MDVQAERHPHAEELVELGRGAEAQLIYEELLARDVNDARAAFQLGRILLERGDLDGIKHLRHAHGGRMVPRRPCLCARRVDAPCDAPP
jgi:hypothetical protein